MDEVIITRAITETYIKELMANLELDVAVVGGGPAGLAAGYYLAKRGVKTAIFERKLSIGGGMWGGGMMFNRIVVQTEARDILDEFGVRYTEYESGYYVSDSVETVSALTYRCARSGCRIFNLITAEDVVIREQDRLAGLVLNWSAVDMAGLHVDPLVMRAGLVIDATGHDAEICRTVTRKIGRKLNTDSGEVAGEKPMWAEVGERELIACSREIYPGLLAAGMAVNAVYGLPRMGPVFGGMLLSGRNAAEKAVELLGK